MPMRVMEEEKGDGSSNGGGEQSSQQSDATQDTAANASESGATADTVGSQGSTTEGAPDDKTAAAAKPKSAFEAVKAVMEKDRVTAATAATTAKAGEATAGTQAAAGAKDEGKEHEQVGEGEKDWLSREEYAKLPPRVKSRLVNLTRQKNEFRDSAKSFEPKARTYDELAQYCQTSGLTQDDFTFGLEVMRLVRTDPGAAWQALQPVIKDLQAFVGEILPTDLQAEVDGGTLSKERAKELAASRRERDRLARGSEVRSEADQRASAQRDYEARIGTVKSALEGWEGSWKTADPDYEKKRERVWERMVVLMGHEPHKLTPEKAVEIAKKAKDDVEKWLTGVMPPKKETKPAPGGGTNTSTKKQPTSALEAARMAVAAR